MFKSHLYGIEIYSNGISLPFLSCLNRTFMELKFDGGKPNLGLLEFKSHLYGIEIKV